MTRVKRGTIKAKKRRTTLSKVKGYNFGRSTKKKLAREAIVHAGKYAFGHRKDKKSDRRRLWQVKINASLRGMDLTYSKVIDSLKKKNIGVDRKILATLAEHNPESFERIIHKL
ncbi:50S ribosomal protein L20 [Candidatus Wolfebacteria bacterium]|nr:MAG: 50S ribosomal protein L20 [Candidatus Wolfebacteria bacterium]